MVAVASAGIDTWSPCWYVERESPAARAMDALATSPSARGKLIPDEVDGHRVGWFPGPSLVYAEGHPGEGDALGRPGQLEDRCRSLESAILDLGVPLPRARARRGSALLETSDRPGLAGVRRLDVTVDVSCERSEGLAMLAGVAALDSGQLDRDVRYNGSSIGTVSWVGARGKVARVYDKGLESGSALRGTRIRLEAQYRWTRDSRREPSELTAAYVRDKFLRRFRSLGAAANGIKVVGKMKMRDGLMEAVESGDLTMAQAEQVIAFQLFEAGGDRGRYSQPTRWRRRQLVERSGFVLADHLAEEVEMDLGAAFDVALEADVWDREK